MRSVRQEMEEHDMKQLAKEMDTRIDEEKKRKELRRYLYSVATTISHTSEVRMQAANIFLNTKD